jgi:hypothetical protein
MSTVAPSSPAWVQPATSNPAVIRSVGRCFVLLLFSFGMWSFAWMYHTTKEVSSQVKQPPPSPGLRTFLYVIPIANYVMWFSAWSDIEDYCKRANSRDFPSTMLWILTFFFSFVGLYSYPTAQSRMNEAHRAATGGRATNARMETVDWIFLILGLLVWGLVVVASTVGLGASH